MIGHNLLLDLLHMCNAFCFDLPDRFADFTTRLAALLPQVIDTKAMCTLAPFKARHPRVSRISVALLFSP